MAQKNLVVHVEWRSRDAARLKSFYGALFDWSFRPIADNYTGVDMGSKEGGGGIMQLREGDKAPPGVTNYVVVDDLAPYEEKVKAAGGQIFMSKEPIEGGAQFSIFSDPDGNLVGLYRAAPAAEPPADEAEGKAEKKARKEQEKAERKAAKKSDKKLARKAKKAHEAEQKSPKKEKKNKKDKKAGKEKKK